MSVTIRPIEARDKNDWLRLWAGPEGYLVFYKSSLPAEVSEITFGRFLDEKEPVYAIVAVDDSTGQIIGFANYVVHRNTWSIDDSLYLNDLFVDESSRLKGTGRKLIEYVYKVSDEKKYSKCYWNTQFENHRAQLLYTKVGVKSGFLLYRKP